ncbi:MAG TPA: DinB family protein [Longimicrobiales bacterium]|nr:DinB family protein [Longimicrobiales bacterium]
MSPIPLSAIRRPVVVGAVALIFALPGCGAPSDAPAQGAQGSGTDAQAMVDNLLTQESTVRDKLMGLAEAIPEEDYDWRPMEGVRSVGEVFQHVAADNYLLPAIAGVAAPEATGIVAADYATVQAYETRTLSKAEIVEQLAASFDHLESAVASTRGDLDAVYQAFGTDFTGGGLWTMAITHLHEHLGQAIAYARSNEVVPPWSR